MAIEKTITLPSRVPVDYHRVLACRLVPGHALDIYVQHYVDKAARKDVPPSPCVLEEQESLQWPDWQAEYDELAPILYRLLKKIEKYQGATDVIDPPPAPQPPAEA